MHSSIKHLNKNKQIERGQALDDLRRGFCYERIQTVAINTNGVEYSVSEVLKIDSPVR